MAKGRIREGDYLLLISFEAGLTWAGAVVRHGARLSDQRIAMENWPVQLPISLPNLNRLEPVQRAKLVALQARCQIIQTAMSLPLPFYARTRQQR